MRLINKQQQRQSGATACPFPPPRPVTTHTPPANHANIGVHERGTECGGGTVAKQLVAKSAFVADWAAAAGGATGGRARVVAVVAIAASVATDTALAWPTVAGLAAILAVVS